MRKMSRREVMMDVGKGMFVASLGACVAADLGLSSAWAKEEPGRLNFGDMELLVSFIQETPPDKILPKTIEKLRAGTSLKSIVAAAALANARTFGGEDYVGFHTLMALSPAYYMANEETDEHKKALPVLKVLYRNANRLKEFGGVAKEVLKPVEAIPISSAHSGGEHLRDAVRKMDLKSAEGMYAGMCGSPSEGLDNLMVMVDDATEVHRVVLVSRAWDLINFVGAERAHTMLRQSVHYCVKGETWSSKHHQQVRELLPKLLDERKLVSRKLGSRQADDAWVAKMADTIFTSTAAQAADAVASALAEGIMCGAIGEAIAVAANQLVLRDAGRPANQTAPNKPVGSIHGDSIGVHACDSANAWRNLSRGGNQRTQVSSLILAAFQVARDRMERGGDFLKWTPYPRAEHLEKVRDVVADKLLPELEGAIKANDQPRSAALAHRYCEGAKDVKPLVALLRSFATSEDGALHAEKYYRTTTEEYAAGRPAFRNRQLVALARVSASACGQPAPGYADACGLLKG